MKIFEKIDNQKKILKILSNLNNNFSTINAKDIPTEIYYIYQINIFLSYIKKNFNKIEKLSNEFALIYENNYFAINNLGNFYKNINKFNKAIFYYKKAVLIKKNLNPFFSKTSIIIKEIEKIIRIKKNNHHFDKLKVLINDLIIEIQTMQLVTFSRPYFSAGFSSLNFLSTNLIKYSSNNFTKKNLLLISSFLEKNLLNTKLITANYDNVFYNLGFCYQSLKNYDVAISFYKLANIYDASIRYNYKILECLYLKKDKKNFSIFAKKFNFNKNFDFNSFAICNYASNQLSIPNPYSFCNDPINFVSKFELLKEKKIDRIFLSKLAKDIIIKTKKVDTPVVKGFKSMGNLYDIKSTSVKKLKKIIFSHINIYKNNFPQRNSILIKNWPKNFNINAWYIRLKKSGEVLSHIHDGWLSGVFYIKKSIKISSSFSNAGELEVSNQYSDLKEFKKNSSKKIITVNEGDLILFPSSLPHRVIPYQSSDERLSVAFDMKPLF
jgi:uncharacterized protein (TIGR02466 family)